MINVGLIGYGLAGRVFHAPSITSVSGLALRAIATTQATRAATAYPDAHVTQPADLIMSPTIDLVVIATPNASHLELGLAALKAGKCVVVDKPMALSIDDAQSLFAAAQRNNRILAPFHNRRWDDDFLTAQSLIRDGVLGEIATFESRFDRFRPQITSRWREEPGPGSGIWWDLGPHLVDQSIHLFGRPDAVTADFARQRQGAEVPDYAHVLLHYGERRAILRASSLVSSRSARLAIEGDAGSFVTEGFDPQEQRLRYPGSPETDRSGSLVTGSGADFSQRTVPLICGDYSQFYRCMRDAMVAGAAPPISAEDALLVTQILSLAEDSSKMGQTLELSA